ncbi:MAG TPA: response regulator [Dyadobacter sp.]|jgi:DNA-binding response OmpR family regulator|nr:response regulator [Dyadobacter sp.]
MHILIVEDDERLATFIKRVLEENDYESTVAYDGMMGLKPARQHDYDLIITDVVLPKMDGIEMCKALRLAKPDVLVIKNALAEPCVLRGHFIISV